MAATQRGPAEVKLKDQAILNLPVGFGFVPRAESARLMEQMGNQTGESFLGLIFPLAEDQNWMMTLDYEGAGYIKDDDAKKWDAEELLQGLKDGTEEGNKFREQRGIKPIEVTGWIEAPNYDAARQRLVWSVGIRDKTQAAGADDGVNYNTYVLGREGYVSMDLITSRKTVEAEKPIARQLLAAVSFNEGKRYADFKPGTDKVAEYGLAALIGGVALKKLGFFALAAAFFAKFIKIIAVAVFGLGVAARKYFKRDKGA